MKAHGKLTTIDQYILQNIDYKREYKDRRVRADLKAPKGIDTTEWKQSLAKGSTAKKHLIEVYTWKFGTKVGTQKHKAWKSNQQNKGTLDYYVKKFGDQEGRKRYKAKCANVSVGYARLEAKFGKEEAIRIRARHAKNSVVDKASLITKYGKEGGVKAYERLCANKRSPRMIKYWTEKGLLLSEAKRKVSEYQTRDKSYFIKKYGKVEGLSRWKTSCFRRGHSLARCVERHGNELGKQKHTEWKHKQRKKGTKTYYVGRLGLRTGLAYYRKVCASKVVSEEKLIAKYGKTKGTAVYQEWSTRGRGSSKAEKELGDFITSLVPNQTVYLGSTNPYMVFLSATERKKASGRKYFVPDIALPESKLIIEYNGDLFHAHPKLFPKGTEVANPWTKETAKVIREKDEVRKAILKKKGFRVVTIWESYYKRNPNETKKRLKELLHETCKTS